MAGASLGAGSWEQAGFLLSISASLGSTENLFILPARYNVTTFPSMFRVVKMPGKLWVGEEAWISFLS